MLQVYLFLILTTTEIGQIINLESLYVSACIYRLALFSLSYHNLQKVLNVYRPFWEGDTSRSALGQYKAVLS